MFHMLAHKFLKHLAAICATSRHRIEFLHDVAQLILGNIPASRTTVRSD